MSDTSPVVPTSWHNRHPDEHIASEAELKAVLNALGAPPSEVSWWVDGWRESVVAGKPSPLTFRQLADTYAHRSAGTTFWAPDRWAQVLPDMTVTSSKLEQATATAMNMTAGAAVTGLASMYAVPSLAAGMAAGSVGGNVLGGFGALSAGPAVVNRFGVPSTYQPVPDEPQVTVAQQAATQAQEPPKPVVPPQTRATAYADQPDSAEFGGMSWTTGTRTWDGSELSLLYRLGAGVPELQALVQQITTDPNSTTNVADQFGNLRPFIGWDRAKSYTAPQYGASPANVQRMEAEATSAGDVNRLSLKEVMNWPYTLRPDEWRNVQEHLVAAGMVDPQAVQKKMISWGNPRDASTMEAWVYLIRQSLAQPDKTMWELLEDNKAHLPEGYLAALRGNNPIRLSDPAAIRAATQRADTETLGRSLDSSRYIDLVHRSETAAGANAQQTTAGTFNDVDAEARIREAIRAENPAEAEAHDVANQFAVFEQLLAGPGYVVR